MPKRSSKRSSRRPTESAREHIQFAPSADEKAYVLDPDVTFTHTWEHSRFVHVTRSDGGENVRLYHKLPSDTSEKHITTLSSTRELYEYIEGLRRNYSELHAKSLEASSDIKAACSTFMLIAADCNRIIKRLMPKNDEIPFDTLATIRGISAIQQLALDKLWHVTKK